MRLSKAAFLGFAPIVMIPMSVSASDPVPEVTETIPVDPSVPPDPSASDEQRSASSSSRMIEEIVVTAQKRDENVQDVPIAIQAFSADMLDARGVQNVQDLPLITPGLTVTQQVGSASTYIRGIGSDTFTLGEPSVATYIDDVYYPLATGSVQNFGAIKRIEVVKGPQGTLFGRNAVGGAVNIITEDPNLLEPRASAQIQGARYNDLESRAYISVPLSEKLAFSLSGFYNEADYYLDGSGGGDPLIKNNEKGARIKVRWAPTDSLDIMLAGLTSKSSAPLYSANSEPSAILGSVIPPQDPRNGKFSQQVFMLNSVDNYYGRVKLSLDSIDVKLFGSRLESEVTQQFDFDGSPLPLVDFNTNRLFSNSTSAELQFTSNDGSWAASWLKWVAGLYYYKAEQGFDPTIGRFGNISIDPDNLARFNLPDPVLQLLNSVSGLGALLPTGEVYIQAISGTKSTAGYAQATASVTDWFDITLGGRFQSEQRRAIKAVSGVYNLDGSVGPKFNDFNENSPGLKRTTTSFNPKVSLDFRPEASWLGSDPLLYASWQKAEKSATFNVVTILPTSDLEYLPPEKITTYEIGIKTALFDGLTRFNAAAFINTVEDAQVQFASLLSGGTITFQSADERVRGIEFDTVTQLLPSITDGLIFTLGATFLDPKYTDFDNANGFNEALGGVYTGGNDYTGNQITRAPKVAASTSLSQTLTVPGGSLELAVDYIYNSKFYYLPQSTDSYKQDAYGILGARVSYLYEPWNVRITAFGRNIGNEDYFYGRFATDFGTLDTPAPLAIYGLRLNWEL